MDVFAREAGDSWAGEEGDASKGANVISYLKSLHEGWSSEVFHVLDNTEATSVEQRHGRDPNSV